MIPRNIRIRVRNNSAGEVTLYAPMNIDIEGQVAMDSYYWIISTYPNMNKFLSNWQADLLAYMRVHFIDPTWIHDIVQMYPQISGK